MWTTSIRITELVTGTVVENIMFSISRLSGRKASKLFGRGAGVFGDVFCECFYDRFGEREFVVYAVVRDRFL
jgi:hypothetical protein